MAKVSALHRGAVPRKSHSGPTLQGLPTTLVCELLTQLGFRLRSETVVYPDLAPATILTWRKRSSLSRATATLFVFGDGSCRVTVTHSHFRDGAAVWKLLKQL
jgi:hypothetical protein